ncbi:uncharacterized protein AMSG_02084 [Thecamonas trahens ATCC 50062]|uniref:Uncharacterized protein n=1 Tax=Thecamonas trahens ATCC 50062 TaxID=461836 RepID=A0A0L0DVA1_THETB|nr:hypothetical protein AMSG_02084 [Thecamonas trahens ATCC 50062]KNC56072.1 hypothetical protein AMSG_02084 [Thecamonas trahens ATCC 50062]|eukprot:XP_013761116.1 hypothetical protein AMSG_02084 [Thecamonas trahens ATCC 50062]
MNAVTSVLSKVGSSVLSASATLNAAGKGMTSSQPSVNALEFAGNQLKNMPQRWQACQAEMAANSSSGTVGEAATKVAYGIQVVGAFFLGEIVGRGSLIGYNVE